MASTSRSEPKYKYISLGEASERALAREGTAGAKSRANIYAVVMESSNVRQTRGTDFICNLRLADSTTDAERTELLCFCADKNAFPAPRAAAGDIIRLHRVRVNNWNGKLQLVGALSQTKPFQFALFDGSRAEKEPYQTSSENYYMDAGDLDQLSALRAVRAQLLGLPTESSYVRQIRELKPEVQRVDVLCKVLHMEQVETFAILHVWDGTEAGDFPVTLNTWDTDTDSSSALPEDLKAFAIPDLLHRCELSENMLGNLVSGSVELVYGTLLPVKISVSQLREVAGIGREGWVLLKNLRVNMAAGQVQCIYNQSSRWSKHVEDEQARAELERKVANGVISERFTQCDAQSLRTRTLHPKKPFMTVRQVRQSAMASGKPGKYRMLVRMVGYSPVDFAGFCKVKKGREGSKSYVFSVRTRVEDPTGELDVILYGEAAEKFLGMRACNMREDMDALDALANRMNEMLGFKDDGEPHEIVWLDLCVLSYFLEDKGSNWDASRFRVFDTLHNN